MSTQQIEFGQTAQDKLTGFKGIVSGYARYITGCDQYLLQPTVKDDGEYQEGRWFDDGRLELVDGKSIEQKDVAGEKNGACGTAPIK